jgi:hypothetical protein
MYEDVWFAWSLFHKNRTQNSQQRTNYISSDTFMNIIRS